MMKRSLLMVCVFFVGLGLFLGVGVLFNNKKEVIDVDNNLYSSIVKSTLTDLVESRYMYLGNKSFKSEELSDEDLLSFYFYNYAPGEYDLNFELDEEKSSPVICDATGGLCGGNTNYFHVNGDSVEDYVVSDYIKDYYGVHVNHRDVVIDGTRLYKFDDNTNSYEPVDVYVIPTNNVKSLFGYDNTFFKPLYTELVDYKETDGEYKISFYKLYAYYSISEIYDVYNSDESILVDDIEQVEKMYSDALKVDDNVNYFELVVDYCLDNNINIAKHEYTFVFENDNFVLKEYKIVNN